MTTYTPEAIEAALDAFVGPAGEWKSESVFITQNRRDCMSRALAAADAAMEAAGFVRVPVEPTEAQTVAGSISSDTKTAYRAMIAARPTTPQDKA